MKELSFDRLTRHGLRHTGATWMADAGIPLHVLQQVLGHQAIETSKGYLHPDHRHREAGQSFPRHTPTAEGAAPPRRTPTVGPPNPAPTLPRGAGVLSCPQIGPLPSP